MIYDPLTIELPKTGGVTTIKELNKLLRKVKVQDLLGYEPDENGSYVLVGQQWKPNETRSFRPKDYNKKRPYLRMTQGGRRRGDFYLTGEVADWYFGDFIYDYTNTFEVRAYNDKICEVRYAKHFPSLEGWMRSVLDPAIRNNFDATWVTKTFKFLVGKATFTYEPVECEGTTLQGAIENFCQQNPAVQYGLDTGSEVKGLINFLEDQSFACEAPVEDLWEAA